jgi:hypothetical protein
MNYGNGPERQRCGQASDTTALLGGLFVFELTHR